MRQLSFPSVFILLTRSAALFVTQTPLIAQFSEEGWVFKGQQDNIQVYYRRTEDVHELKVVTTMRGTLSGVVRLFDDVPNYPKWGYRLRSARLVQRVSEVEMYYYVCLDFPWPLSDRDLIMHTHLKQDPNTRILTSTSRAAPDRLPEEEGTVRIRKAHSKWVITPVAPGLLSVEYYLYSNPGGHLPDWLINMALDVGPRQTLKNMRALLLDPSYQNVRLAHIRE